MTWTISHKKVIGTLGDKYITSSTSIALTFSKATKNKPIIYQVITINNRNQGRKLSWVFVLIRIFFSIVSNSIDSIVSLATSIFYGTQQIHWMNDFKRGLFLKVFSTMAPESQGGQTGHILEGFTTQQRLFSYLLLVPCHLCVVLGSVPHR